SFTFFLRRALVEAVGGFDEGLGAGSPGPFGAGEESDLVLRLLAAGARIDYDPAIVVHHDEPRSAADDAFVAKMERYGAGQGLLWRRHRASPVSVGYLLGRKAGGALVRRVRGDAVLSRADVAYL